MNAVLHRSMYLPLSALVFSSCKDRKTVTLMVVLVSVYVHEGVCRLCGLELCLCGLSVRQCLI